VPRDGHIRLEIFNLLGQKIQTLVNQVLKRGTYQVTWDGTDEEGASVSNGIYFCQLEAENFKKSNKMMLLK
jgi:flagellar hook assembly protein FlgD